MARFAKRIACVAGLGLLASACVTPPPPPAEAVVEFAPVNPCSTSVELTKANPMVSETPTGSIRSVVALTSASPCVITDDGASPYAVFQLPSEPNLVSVMLGAGISPTRLAPPIVELYAGNGEMTRRFTADQMQRRGLGLAALVRPHGGEAYAVVRVDPSNVGESYSTASRNPRYVEAHRGQAAFGLYERDYSFEGDVFAIAYFEAP